MTAIYVPSAAVALRNYDIRRACVAFDNILRAADILDELPPVPSAIPVFLEMNRGGLARIPTPPLNLFLGDEPSG
jgi:hypothetical protein